MSVSHAGILIKKSPSYKWILNNSCIKSCKNIGDAVESPPIEIDTNNGSKQSWALRFYPKSKDGIETKFASIVLVSKNVSKTEVFFDFAVIQEKNVIHLYDDGQLVSFPRKNFEWGDRLLRKSQIMDGVSGKLKCNRLTILCRIRPPFYAEIDNLMADMNKQIIHKSDEDETEDNDAFNNLIVDDSFGDFSLIVRGKVFRVHADILSEQSYQFAEIVSNQRGKNRKVAFIDDMDPRVFSQILRVIYFQDVIVDVDKIADLLIAADKYSLEKLYAACEMCMLATFGNSNMVKYLKFAHKHGMVELKKTLVEFITVNFPEMLADDCFESIKNLEPDLMFEVMQGMAKL
ncbi:hypothetical protein QAD02_023999 [Eretmocerus hayati]|uniref:Uncharacterized protein n=1 Tax=Eretmocerus hayati TaxID=131215 RepID=A0ACC2PZZ6_9HYME|nr:hypothetical protein QAD02_023999 [Eretmocerus hayati]